MLFEQLLVGIGAILVTAIRIYNDISWHVTPPHSHPAGESVDTRTIFGALRSIKVYSTSKNVLAFMYERSGVVQFDRARVPP